MHEEQLRTLLVEKMGLAGIAQEKQDALITQMTEVLLKKIFIETVEQLSEDDQKDFEAIVKAGDAAAVETFVREKITDYDAFIQNIITTFLDEMQKVANEGN